MLERLGIAAGALGNFVLSDRLVFRPRPSGIALLGRSPYDPTHSTLRRGDCDGSDAASAASAF